MLPEEILLSLPPLGTVEADGRTWQLYDEPGWLRHQRVSRSCPAMAEFILDELIPPFVPPRGQRYPFFLRTGQHAQSYWGRQAWIEDLGICRYCPAFDALREVWLHDIDEYLPSYALNALGRLTDPRLLDDIEQKIRESESLEEAVQFVHPLCQYKDPRAVDIVMRVANWARLAHEGPDLRWDERMRHGREIMGETGTTMALLQAIQVLGRMDSPYAESQMVEIAGWFPKDRILSHRCSQILDMRYQSPIVIPDAEKYFDEAYHGYQDDGKPYTGHGGDILF